MSKVSNSIKCPYCGKERIQLVISSTVSHWNLVGRDHNGEPLWGWPPPEGWGRTTNARDAEDRSSPTEIKNWRLFWTAMRKRRRSMIDEQFVLEKILSARSSVLVPKS